MRLLSSVAMVALLGLFSGCGRNQLKTAVVKGNISYQEKPVPNGTIMFVATLDSTALAGPTPTGEIQPDGSYTLTSYVKGDGAVPGKYKVVIVAVGDRSDSGLPEARNPLAPPIIPEKYTSAATSPLQVEVKDEVNTLDFQLDVGKN